MASPHDAEEEAGNPYLAMRSAKIARNEQRLKELGLWRPSGGAPPRPRPTRRQKPTPPVHQGPVRRSGRLSSQARPDYKDASLPTETAFAAGRKRPISPTADDLHLDDAPAPVPVAKRAPSTTPAKAPAPNSVRSIDLNVKRLLLGEGDTAAGLLGKMVEQTGKEHVINQSFALAASAEDQERLANTKLSFNKYCGVQEWGNCVFLWVNLGTPDSPNDFLDDGRQVTWFGGSRMHDDSPVIHKLLEYGREASRTKDSNIILWCRKYRPEEKKFTPYVCFGRMGYKSHVPGSRPLAFVWDLLDHEGLKRHSDAVVRETFEEFTS